jgi:branched-chain amino acid transport system permease protein
MVFFADRLGLNIWLAVLIAAVVAAALSVPLAGLAFRLRGGYFAIGTWVIAEAIRLLISNIPAVGGGSGVTLAAAAGIDRSLRIYLVYSLALVVGVGSIVTVYLLMRRRLGLALTANRDSEIAAGSLGVNVTRTKLIVYIIAAFGCALAGAVTYLNLLRIQPDSAFSVNWSAFMIFMVVIGGVGTIEGPLIGAVVFFALQQVLAPYGSWYLILLGAVAIVVALRAPRGLWGLIADRFGVQLFPVRRRLVVDAAPTTQRSEHGAATD